METKQTKRYYPNEHKKGFHISVEVFSNDDIDKLVLLFEEIQRDMTQRQRAGRAARTNV